MPLTSRTFIHSAITFVLATLLAACGSKTETAPVEVIRPVVTFTVGGTTTNVAGASFAAEIKPRVEARMAFRVGGKIAERMVDIGTPVKAGQALMRLDVSDLQLAASASAAQVAAAKANDDLAQAELKRTQALSEQGFVSAGRLEQAQGQAKASRANLEALQASANVQTNATQYAVLRADAAGIVTAVDGEIGQVVAAGTPMLRIAQGAEKDVLFSVPESFAQAARTLRGKTITVQLWSQAGVQLNASVREVAAIADPATRSFAIKASLIDPNNTAALGATATALLPIKAATSSPTTLVIPMSAVVESQGKAAVWVLEGGVVKKRTITLTAAPGDNVAVTQGLSAGSVIVTAGVHTLTEGQKVKPLLTASTAAGVEATTAGAPKASPAAPATKP